MLGFDRSGRQPYQKRSFKLKTGVILTNCSLSPFFWLSIQEGKKFRFHIDTRSNAQFLFHSIHSRLLRWDVSFPKEWRQLMNALSRGRHDHSCSADINQICASVYACSNDQSMCPSSIFFMYPSTSLRVTYSFPNFFACNCAPTYATNPQNTCD